jgi:hypothetical protein
MFDITDNHAQMRRYTNLFRKDVFLAAHLAHDYNLFAPIMNGTVGAAERYLQLWDRVGAIQA